MAIFPQTAAMILKEHKHRPIAGDVLLIGRQTVLLTVETAQALMAREGVEVRDGSLTEIDRSTVGAEQAQYITDRTFFSMFCDAKVIALDVSDYEDAEIVHDLNAPLPAEHERVADFIFNGSCLDNLFDPATAMKSLSKMLRPNGRIMHVEHGTPINGAYLCYSPEWFFSFYAANDYLDCQTYVCTFGGAMSNRWRVYKWHPYRTRDGRLVPSHPSLAIGDFVNLVIAEKGAASSDTQTPIQGHYRLLQQDSVEPIYVDNYERFRRSGRSLSFSATGLQELQKWFDVKALILNALGRCGLALVKGGSWRYRLEWVSALRKRELEPLGTLQG
jgi:SAM-dependent methyltransferase